ncbi:putative lipoprotein [Porphyromonas catoniae ATCC 51270]|uniref:Putative lipoprotein n=2 Tax=Porphyromonas catoniae TaxID=41976 RepID=Z4WYB9_9PORP|nr:putative lipoprotein [Porphyromonas catoniae ATCC 51270]
MRKTLWGLFFVATMLSSCKKEDPNSPSFTQSSEKEMKSRDAHISFDMEVDQPKALNFDINADGLPLLIRSQDKIKVYCSIVQSEASTVNFYGGGFVELKRVPGTTNTFRARDAAIKMWIYSPYREDNLGTRCTMSCAIIPMTAEEENLAKDGKLMQAMIIQQSTPNTPGQATVVHPNDTRVTLNIPYFSSEVQMKFERQKGGEMEGRALAKVKIKPYGTLLRHRFVNKTTQPISIKRFGLFTTGFSQNIAVDLNHRYRGKEQDSDPTVYPTARIVKWYSGSNRYQVYGSHDREQRFSVADYELQTPLQIPAGQTSDAYILTWGYPHSEGLNYFYRSPQHNDIVKYPRVIRVYYAETETGEKLAVSGYKINYSYLPPAGTSYTVTSTINRPRLPIDYVLYANLSGDGRLSTFNPEPVGTDPIHSRADVNYPKTYFDMMHVSIGEIAANPAEKFGHNPMHAPTPEDWRSICAESKDLPNTKGAKKTGVSETIKFGNVSGTFTADYKLSNDLLVLYGLRLKGNGDKYLSAWRYVVKQIPGGFGGPTIDGPGGWPAFGKNSIVQVRYLGPGSPVTIDDIAQENWWTTNNQNDEIRAFPHLGYEDWYSPAPGHGRVVFPGIISYLGEDPTNGMVCWFNGRDMTTPVHKSTLGRTFKYTIRPFFDK